MKYYAVIYGIQPGIYSSWEKCKKQVNGYSGAAYKGFDTKNAAIEHYEKITHQTPTLYLGGNGAPTKMTSICALCQKPFTYIRGKKKALDTKELCPTCQKTIKKFPFSKLTHGIVKYLTLNELMYLQDYYEVPNVFQFMREYPTSIIRVYDDRKKLRLYAGSSLTIRNRTDSQYNGDNGDNIPLYLKQLLGEHQELIKLTGSKLNPVVFYHCHRCNKDFVAQYSSLKRKRTHQCDGIMSTGETAVREYLSSNNIPFQTQRQTLKCKNPDTGRVMPYDFELTGKNIIIEVQGEQHRTFTPLFHIDEDGFAYQQQKDAYKKQFAIDHGYKVLEIWYEDIQSGRYKQLIQEAL